jgi:hypothetical protein
MGMPGMADLRGSKGADGRGTERSHLSGEKGDVTAVRVVPEADPGKAQPVMKGE